MEKYLITGFSGFVGRHFIEYLDTLDTPVNVLGIDIHEPAFTLDAFKNLTVEFKAVNLLDKEKVEAILKEYQPGYILHLAAFSSVAFSWKNPVESFSNNTTIFLNIIDQVRKLNIGCRILSVGSSEVYGNVAPDELPLTEQGTLKPLSPYAVARVSQEMLSATYTESFGLDIVTARSFNHIGPGQKDTFVIASFAKQLAEIKKFGKLPHITTGNLEIVRDFLDVRDIVQAYYLLLKKGIKGEVYNVCSGNGTALKNIVHGMAEMLDLKIETITDNSLVRQTENTIVIGNNNKIKRETGWLNRYTLTESLGDILKYWEANI